jgi:hypothetical protein
MMMSGGCARAVGMPARAPSVAGRGGFNWGSCCHEVVDELPLSKYKLAPMLVPSVSFE